MKEFWCAPETYSFVFSPYAKPIARVAPGEVIVVHTEDAFCGCLTDNNQILSEVGPRFYNPQTGPFYIEGAEPGDVLKVEILQITPDRDWAASCIQGGFGGVMATKTTRMLNPPVPERTYIYKYDGKNYTYSNQLSFGWKPFLGTIATAPEIEALSALTPFAQGGNMDVPDVCPGNVIYLPVAIDGALFYVGDCHATQGEGELCGSALEISAKVELRFELIKNKQLSWPRIESKTEIMCIGSAKPMEDAARIAMCELIEWLEELGWEKWDAVQAVSQGAKLYVANMVDTTYSLVAKIDKEIAYRK